MGIHREDVTGIVLPDEAYRILRRASTSLIFETVRGVQVYTIEKIKLDWWKHLGMIAEYRAVGECSYRRSKTPTAPVPLYLAANMPHYPYCHNRYIPEIMNRVRRAAHPDYSYWWEALAKSKSKPVNHPARWLLEEYSQQVEVGMIYPDYDDQDFIQIDTRHLECIDPFHDIRLQVPGKSA